MPDFLLQSGLPAPSSMRAVPAGTQETVSVPANALSNIQADPSIKVFFHKEDLNELFNQVNENNESSEGLRFYPSFAVDVDKTTGNVQFDERSFSLLVVGTTINRDDIVSFDASINKCFVARPNQHSQNVGRREAFNMMLSLDQKLKNDLNKLDLPFSLGQNLSPRGKSYAKVYFSKKTISVLLKALNVIGINFYSARISFNGSTNTFPTLVAVAVDDSGSELSSTATMSALPCPPDCGGGSYTDAVDPPPQS